MTRTLCAVFAHPDDESFSAGGLLARYADEGVRTTLVTATRGEAGEIGEGLPPIDDLGAWRQRELAEAAEILGVGQLRILGLPDGRLEEDPDELYRRVKEALAEIRPQVVITEDIQGITGHPDHIAVTRAVIRAFDELETHGLLKLYLQALPISMVKGMDSLTGTPDEFITTCLDVERWRELHLRALAAHRSQVPQETVDRFRSFPAPWRLHYVCIRARVPIRLPEDDLFQGIPE